jgi:hypothetical protein
VNQQSIVVLLLSMNLTGCAIKMITYFIHNPLRNLPIKITTIQQLLTNLLVNKTQITPLMTQPYEIINITNLDIQMETKPDP